MKFARLLLLAFVVMLISVESVQACVVSRTNKDVEVTCPSGQQAIAGVISVPRSQYPYNARQLYNTIATECGTSFAAPTDEVEKFVAQYQDDFHIISTTDLMVTPYTEQTQQSFDAFNNNLLKCRTKEYKVLGTWLMFYEHNAIHCTPNGYDMACGLNYQIDLLPLMIYFLLDPRPLYIFYFVAILIGIVATFQWLRRFGKIKTILQGLGIWWVIVWLFPPFSIFTLGILGVIALVRMVVRASIRLGVAIETQKRVRQGLP